MSKKGTVYERKGSKYLWLRYWNGSCMVRESSGETDRGKAEAELHRRESLVGKLSYVQAAHAFFDLKKRTCAPATIRQYEMAMVNWDPFVGELTLEEIDRDLIRKFVTSQKVNKVSDLIIRRDLAYMSSLFSTAAEWEGGPSHNPFVGYRKTSLRMANKRVRFLTPTEFQRLLTACPNQTWRGVVTLAVETGMRDEEIRKLTWDRVDLRNRLLYLVETKNGEQRAVPLSNLAVSTLSAQPVHPESRYVFWHGKGRPYAQRFTNGAWNDIAKRAKLKDVHFHDLRHTFASWFVQRGGDIRRLQDILGHKSPAMTQRYNHLRTVDLQRAIDELEPRRELIADIQSA